MQFSRSKTPVFPSLSKSQDPKPQLESSVYKDLISALSILPHRRTQSSPAPKTTSITPTPKKSNPFSLFSSKSAKESPKSPVEQQQHVPHASLKSNKATLPPARPVPNEPPPLPPKSIRHISLTLGSKSAPGTRPITPATSKPLPEIVPSLPPPPRRQPVRPSTAGPYSVRSSGSGSSSGPSFALPTAASQARAAASRPKVERRQGVVEAKIVIPEPKMAIDSRMTESSDPPPLRPRAATRTPTSPPSAFSTKTPPPPRPLPRKRSKTFPDPSDPVIPSPPQTHSLKTASRILEAFEASPRMNSPEIPTSPRSPSARTASPFGSYERMHSPVSSRSKMTPPRTLTKERVIPKASAVVAPMQQHARASSYSKVSSSPISKPLVPSSAPPGRSSFDTGLVKKQIPVIPAKIIQPDNLQPKSPTTTKQIPVIPARKEPHPARKLARPALKPLETTPYSLSAPAVLRATSPVTPDTQPSSESPKTPAAPGVDPSCVTSDDEGSRNSSKRTFKTMFRRKQRPDSINSAGTFSSLFSGSGSSNGSNARSMNGKKAGTLSGWEEQDEIIAARTETRHGIRRHAHPPAEVPYPVSYEEMVLQGEKHTQDLLSLVLNQKAYHFTPIDNFSKLKNVLDLGCGRGYWLTDAVKECKQANFVGFDLVDIFLSPAEMKERRGLTDNQIARIEFVRGNFFSTLPFPADHFDFIRLAFVELAIPETKWNAVLREAWRVLKPGGNLEVIIESQLFPTVWSYKTKPVQQSLEADFRQMLEKRDISAASSVGEKMFFDPFARVQTHQHVSVCVAPRPAGRSSLDGPNSPRNFGSLRGASSPWSSEPAFGRGLSSPTEGRPSLDYKGRPSLEGKGGRPDNILPPVGQLVTSRICSVPGLVVLPDVFLPVPEEELYNYASHGAMILNATRLATFTDAYPDVPSEEQEDAWEEHVEKYWSYERSNRLRLGFRMKQFDDDDVPEVTIPTQGRWKWAKCDEDLERPLEIRRFRAWSLTKPTTSR